ncbi:hypothetical protein Taro_045429 [Colocasia esculenta]|uniref:Embryo defective 2759 n=1 Tax=Colocasia esculenta TaxID=4460 RepID=A0A843WRA0_COLES|nr:hypothetical protein [Colocasia esculenta]
MNNLERDEELEELYAAPRSPCSSPCSMLKPLVQQPLGSSNGLANRVSVSTCIKKCDDVRGQPIILPREKPFRVCSFKGNGQNGADEIDRDSKFSKKPVQLSHAPHEMEEIVTASPDVTTNSLSYASGEKEGTVSGSQAIERLFKKWLTILHTQASSEATDDVYGKRTPEIETSEDQVESQRVKVDNVFKVALIWYMGLDATIKIPLTIFIPWYLITRVIYGIEVAKELTPLWVIGPLVTALYIKIIQGICFLYSFCFKQVVRFVGNVPSYYVLIHSYVTEGKLKAFLYACFCQPIVDVKNMDYKALLLEKLKQLKEWAKEKYLDYVESIWPYYCRTIRFLKKANLL